MKLSCIAKFLHTVLYSIMVLHEGFLCAADEYVGIEVINPLSADGTLLHILLQWDSQEQSQCYYHLVTGNGELWFCWDGPEPCTCMLLHGGVHCPFVSWVQAVVELLEGLICYLFSKGVLEFETWVTI